MSTPAIIITEPDFVEATYEVLPMSFIASRVGELNLVKLWHLSGTVAGGANVIEAWRYAQGQGVLIGVVDEGVNTRHADLAWAYDATRAYDPRDAADAMNARSDTSAEFHGTNVSGLISGDLANDIGSVGGAQSSTFTATYIRYGASFAVSELSDIIAHQSRYDVSNNSWGFTSAFADNFSGSVFAPTATAMHDVASNGRGGLGTVLVFAAGNGNVMDNGISIGDDSGFHNLTNSRFSIAVGAHDASGAPAFFSSPGANVLLTAPGVGVRTTDGMTDGATGYAYVSGTSFAAPIVSSTVALMLSANPLLGYRDVQEILALSAHSRFGGSTTANGADHFNGGGLMFDREGGFGTLDAAAAVNLARNWEKQSTAANEQHLDASFAIPAALDTSLTTLTTTLTSPDGRGFSIDHVDLDLSIYDRGLKDLSVTLISPDGTRTALAESMASIGSRSTLTFTFGSVATWGENAFGAWQVELKHAKAPAGFLVFDAKLHVYGDYDTPDDTYYVTGSFADLVSLDASRATFDDTDGGTDTLNFAAARSAASVDLSLATRSTNAGVAITLKGQFENVVGTVYGDGLTGSDLANQLVGDDGNDRLVGGGGDDRLEGGLGDDRLEGGAGSDVLDGGVGIDTLVFAGGFATYTVSRDGATYRVADAAGAVDVVTQAEFLVFDDITFDLSTNAGLDVVLLPVTEPAPVTTPVADSGTGTVIETVPSGPRIGAALRATLTLEQGASEALLALTSPSAVDARAVTVYTVVSLPPYGVVLSDGKPVTLGAVLTADQFAALSYSTANRAYAAEIGFRSDDGTTTHAYTVTIEVGRAVSKTYVGTELGERIDGAAGHDVVEGRGGDDTLVGGLGNDTIDGGSGVDAMKGGLGNDTYVVDRVGDTIVEAAGEGIDSVQSTVSFVLSDNVERLILTGTADIAGTGNALANTLIGNVGRNLLNGGLGADTMKGGAGDDTYLVDDAGDKVVETTGAAQGTDTVRSSISYRMANNVETLILSGTDAVNGTGNAIANVITGNGAANRLDGGLGSDILNGGAGNDTFVFTTVPTATNIDHLVDFAPGRDSIELSKAVFKILTADATTGIITQGEFKVVSATTKLDVDDHILYDRTTGFMFYDSDGSGKAKAIHFATIDNSAGLTFSDVHLV